MTTSWYAQYPAEDAVRGALAVAEQYGQIEGDHHRAWCIDQMVRALTGTGYERWRVEYCAGDDGPETYEWREGIAP